VSKPEPGGLVGEYASPEQLVLAIGSLRALGLQRLDALTPFPVHAAEEALGLGRPRTPRWALLGGLVGAGSIYTLQWWINVVDDPLDVGGRPLHSVPAFIPWTFEAGILLAAFGVFLAFCAACGLPRLWHPLFEVEGVERATHDRFFIVVDARDPHFEGQRVEAALQTAGAVAVRRVASR
jgi:hypothetical protein